MRKTRQERQTTLIESLAAARGEILSLAEQVPPERRDAQFLGTWCVKDLLAHLIGWDHTNLQAVQEILAGMRPGFFQFYDKDWQRYNGSLVAAHRREPFDALLADAAASHSKLLVYLRAQPPEAVLEGKYSGETGRTVTIRNLLRAEAVDELRHAAQLREFLAQVSRETA